MFEKLVCPSPLVGITGRVYWSSLLARVTGRDHWRRAVINGAKAPECDQRRQTVFTNQRTQLRRWSLATRPGHYHPAHHIGAAYQWSNMAWPNPKREECEGALKEAFVRYTWDIERRRESTYAHGYGGALELPDSLISLFSSAQVRSGYAIDADCFFTDPEMPWWLKLREPPYYVLVKPEDDMRDNKDRRKKFTKKFSHPLKGDIDEVSVVSTSLFDNEEFNVMKKLGTSVFVATSPSNPADRISLRLNDYLTGGDERYQEANVRILRDYFDNETGKYLGQRVLNDECVIRNRAWSVFYAGAGATESFKGEAPKHRAQWTRRFDNGVGCMICDEKNRYECERDCDGIISLYAGPPNKERCVGVVADPPTRNIRLQGGEKAPAIVYEAKGGARKQEYTTHRLYEDGTFCFFRRTRSKCGMTLEEDASVYEKDATTTTTKNVTRTQNVAQLYKAWLADGQVNYYEVHDDETYVSKRGFEPRQGTGPFGLPRYLLQRVEKYINADALEAWNLRYGKAHLWNRWHILVRRALKRAIVDKRATKANKEEANHKRKVRQAAKISADVKSEQPYTKTGPSHKTVATTWVADQAASDTGTKSKRSSKKTISIEMARMAADAKRETAERQVEEELKRLHYLKIGYQIIDDEP